MDKLKERIKKNTKIIYIAIIVIILAGMANIYFHRLNFTLMYGEHTRIDIYTGKEINSKEIKELTEEVLGKQAMSYQKIETFNDAIAIHVKEVTDEQVTTLKEKVKEKYSIEDDDFLEKTQVAAIRARDILKPYVISSVIVTLLIIGYIGVRYMKLGAMKSMAGFIIKLILAELVYLAIIGIIGIPIGNYTMPVAIAIYLIVTMAVISSYQNKLEIKEIEEKKK